MKIRTIYLLTGQNISCDCDVNIYVGETKIPYYPFLSN